MGITFYDPRLVPNHELVKNTVIHDENAIAALLFFLVQRSMANEEAVFLHLHVFIK